ncbi:MAG TPA: AbrB/MazE/SpoVT family DNA-binding domain-containing protein [Thermoanaerobaculia bacterium]|jgi:AbrB family looped-hinge helix DNA binding protein|nr:AbrB/MazE/SpoVT family DNA-binding domain-containing protein [Thermoanaerobaculia bacterium]
MILSSAKLTEKYQITIPSEVRRRLGLESGDVVLLRLDGEQITLESAKGGWCAALRGLGAEVWHEAGGAAAIEREREGWE